MESFIFVFWLINGKVSIVDGWHPFKVHSQEYCEQVVLPRTKDYIELSMKDGIVPSEYSYHLACSGTDTNSIKKTADEAKLILLSSKL